MSERKTYKEATVTGIEDIKKYANEQKKFAGILYRPFFKDLQRSNHGGHYLDIGAGPGMLDVMIAEANPRVNITAIDISPDMVGLGSELIRERNLQDRIQYLQVDANDKKAVRELGKFDLVYSTFVMHYWPDPSESIMNLWENVNDEGSLYIYDFNRVWWLYYLPFNNGDINAVRASFTPSELNNAVKKAGLRNFRIKTFFPCFLQLTVHKK